MSRRIPIVCTMIVFAFITTVSGCSSASTPTLTRHTGAVSNQTPQSLGNWTTKASMPTAREALAACVVGGRLYAVGGWNNDKLKTVEAYDHTSNTWTKNAPMPTAREGLAVGVVNGILYAVGGYKVGGLNTVEAYNPATNTWSAKAPMPTLRPGCGRCQRHTLCNRWH